MKKFLAVAAVALIGLVGINGSAKAFDNSLMTGSSGASMGALGTAAFVGVASGIAILVYNDIKAGGLNRKYAEVAPGAGFQSRDYATAAKLTHEFNVAMGYADDEQTMRMLASAAH